MQHNLCFYLLLMPFPEIAKPFFFLTFHRIFNPVVELFLFFGLASRIRQNSLLQILDRIIRFRGWNIDIRKIIIFISCKALISLLAKPNTKVRNNLFWKQFYKRLPFFSFLLSFFGFLASTGFSGDSAFLLVTSFFGLAAFLGSSFLATTGASSFTGSSSSSISSSSSRSSAYNYNF